MKITQLTITQGDQVLKTFSDTEKDRAVSTAKALAATTGKPVSVMARLDDGSDREVIFNPDGSNERIWAIDKGHRLVPVVGQIYTNRGGGKYRCLMRKVERGTVYCNAHGGASNTGGVFQNTENGWTFTAKGIVQYIDGTIEWDHSVGGTFEELAAN